MMLMRSNAPSLMGLGAAADVQNLQQALLALAQKTGNAAINPGPINGTLNDQTMTALQGAITYVAKDLPSSIYVPLQALMIGGATTSMAKQYVEQYATPLAMAINAANAKIAGSAPPGAVIVPTPAWYQTTIGKIGIVAAVLGGVWYFFFREPTAKAA